MYAPKGMICSIETGGETTDSNGNKVAKAIRGVLAEGVNITLQSQYKPMFSDSDVNNAQVQGALGFVDAAGGIARSLSGGRGGLSSKFKHMTTQVWDKTEPMSFNVNIEFRRDPLNGSLNGNGGGEVNAMRNLMPILREFCSLPLPAEGFGGNLTPPGPSFIEGLGIDEIIQNKTSGGDEAFSTDVREGSGIVNVAIGSMRFRRLIMMSAEPSFSQWCDDSGYPISCRIAFNFRSIWAATKSMVEEW